MNDRINWIDFAKGLCIILVVTGHIINGYLVTYSMQHSNLLIFSRILYLFHVHVFFFIAGMFFYQSFYKRGKKDFVVEKLKTILYPYFLWSIIQGCVEIAFSHFTAVPLSMGQLFAILYRPISQFWFLYSLFVMNFLFALFADQGKKAITLLMATSVILYFINIPTTFFDLGNMSKFMIFFICGMLFKQFKIDDRVSLITNFSTVMAVACLFVVFSHFSVANEVLLHAFLIPSLFGIIIGKLFVFCLSSMGIFMIILLSQYLCKFRIFSFISMIGTYSLAIFCAHGLFGSGCRIILNQFFDCLDPVVFIPLSIISGIVFPVVLYRMAATLDMRFLFVLK